MVSVGQEFESSLSGHFGLRLSVRRLYSRCCLGLQSLEETLTGAGGSASKNYFHSGQKLVLVVGGRPLLLLTWASPRAALWAIWVSESQARSLPHRSESHHFCHILYIWNIVRKDSCNSISHPTCPPCVVTLTFLPSRGGVCVPFPWIWLGLKPQKWCQDAMWLPRLGHKRWYSFNLAVHIRKQPPCCKEAQTSAYTETTGRGHILADSHHQPLGMKWSYFQKIPTCSWKSSQQRQQISSREKPSLLHPAWTSDPQNLRRKGLFYTTRFGAHCFAAVVTGIPVTQLLEGFLEAVIEVEMWGPISRNGGKRMGRELLGLGSFKPINYLIYSVSVMEESRKKFSLLTLTFLKNILSARFRIILINHLNKHSRNEYDGITLLSSEMKVIKKICEGVSRLELHRVWSL